MQRTIISAFLGEYIDAVAIVAIVLINGVLGFLASRAPGGKTFQALKELSTPHVYARRNNEWIKIPSKTSCARIIEIFKWRPNWGGY
ncbi:hypothetical protein ACEQPO_12610 [Bacillus sp. SL00103]